MANPELSQLEKIKKTREVIDPGRRGTLIGTSGIALYFNGFEWPVAPVGDLDLRIESTAEVILMRNRLSRHRRIKSAEFRKSVQNGKKVPIYDKVDVIPRNPKALLSTNIFTAIDDSRFYISPEQLREQRIQQEGEFTLDLPTLLTWKMLALREKDIRDGAVLTEAAIEHELVSPVAASSLRKVIDNVRTLVPRQDTDSYGL